MEDLKQPILFYDSYCLRCSRIIQWLLNNTQNVYFSPLKGEVAENILTEKPRYISNDSIIFFSINHQKKAEFFDRIDAVLKVLAYSRKYSWLRFWIKLIPKRLLNALYSLVAKLRKRQSNPICLIESEHRILK